MINEYRNGAIRAMLHDTPPIFKSNQLDLGKKYPVLKLGFDCYNGQLEYIAL